MKIVVLIVPLFVVFLSNAQYSYYFANPLPSAESKVDYVDENYFGVYTSKSGALSYQFDADGLTLISTSISSISKELVRESSKYSVRNGYLFGVKNNDSVPCTLENGAYFFGVRNQDRYIGEYSQHILTRTESPGVYILNEFEDGRYVPKQLEFQRNKLIISNFDYEGDIPNEFNFIEQKETLPMEGLNLVILKPEASDFDRIASKAFVENMVFKR